MKVTLDNGLYGWDYYVVREDGESDLIQSDWDYPSTARTFGWSGVHRGKDGRFCNSGATDGTVDCRDCGATRTQLLGLAQDYLDAHIGDTVQVSF